MIEENIKVLCRKTYYCTTFLLKNVDTDEIYSSLDVEKEDIFDKKDYIPEFSDKKVLYLYNFTTKEKYRNKGYAKHLLKYVIDFFKDNEKNEFDMLHLNACPYYVIGGIPVYEPPTNGLPMEKLLEFYQSLGLEPYKEYNQTSETKGMIMIMNF
jgi:GNAT superfamily N-acetyltransferase